LIVAVVVVVFAEWSSGDSAVTVTLLWNGGTTVDEQAEERTLARPLLDWHWLEYPELEGGGDVLFVVDTWRVIELLFPTGVKDDGEAFFWGLTWLSLFTSALLLAAAFLLMEQLTRPRFELLLLTVVGHAPLLVVGTLLLLVGR
jgi:hypothetical protein